MLMYWTHQPWAPWQCEQWINEMRRALRPNQFLHMIEKRWVTTESNFVHMTSGMPASIRTRMLVGAEVTNKFRRATRELIGRTHD